MNLRLYQDQAFEAAIAWMKRRLEPALIEMATGSGKSWIVAAIANWLQTIAPGKVVVCIQPSKELTEQNHEKYITTGNPASIFSASVGEKCLAHPVVYCTPLTMVNALHQLGEVSAIIIDEAHGLTPTIAGIVAEIRRKNPRARLIGLTATPYRTGTGYIYQRDVDGRLLDDDEVKTTKDGQTPYAWFYQLIYRVTTQELLSDKFGQPYLTPPLIDSDHTQGYDAQGLQLNKQGKFDSEQVEKVFVGKGRLTAAIVEDIVEKSKGRRGVMIFAATVAHAQEIMESLPPENSRMLGGKINMKRKIRRQLIKDFKAQKFKYLVSVGTCATGFDAPHVDVLAFLRKTESAVLFEQMLGRGTRLYDGKDNFLVLDYAGNIEFHGLQDDLFTPKIKVSKDSDGGQPYYLHCPACRFENAFSLKDMETQWPPNAKINDEGYFVDHEGRYIHMDGNPVPEEFRLTAHHGRRCKGEVRNPDTLMFERCPHLFTYKQCDECEYHNDISARHCKACQAELIDPNEKLKVIRRAKHDPSVATSDKVLRWEFKPWKTKNGASALRLDLETQYSRFPLWIIPPDGADSKPWQRRIWYSLCSACGLDGKAVRTAEEFVGRNPQMPSTVKARRRDNGYFTVLAFGLEEDLQ